jgi:hypothetical protein
MTATNIIRELGDGLILRRSTRADAEKLADFNSRIHSEDGPDKPDDRLGWWTRDLLERPHPTFGEGDYTIVEEQATGRIVSSLNHISQTWTYDGIPFRVGRPELVGTLPEYRHKRLVGLQFDEIHRWSAERGEMVQVITGIPHYYKRFEYEMGLELGGGRVSFAPLVPALKEGESEPFTFRPAGEADIPFLGMVYEHAGKRQLVRSVRDEAIWRYELNGKSERNVNRSVFRIIENVKGEPVGYVSHPWFNWDWGIPLFEFELKPGVSWLEVTPSAARYVLATSKEYALRDKQPVENKTAVPFWHGSWHPVYEVWRDKLPRIRLTYAWYVRVPDLPGFLRHITPVLEKRLAESWISGHTGSLRLNLYKTGIKLTFENGKVTSVESYKPEPIEMGEIGLPDLSVLQLVFGYRSIDELRAAYTDCYWDTDDARVVTAMLFPKKPSSVAGLV